MKRLFFLVSISLFAFSAPSWAATETDGPSTVSLISAQNLVTAFQLADRDASDDCFLGLVFLDITTDQGRSEYDAILSAQAEGTSITISYEQVGTGCTLNFVNRLAE